MSFKITYSVLNADMSELHKQFDAAMQSVRASLGQEYPSWVAGKPYKTGKLLENRNPARTKELLGKFHVLQGSDLEVVMNEAVRAQKIWGMTPWKERAAIIRKAADLISERRMEISAIMCLETGKNRLESLGDVEESADLFRYYAGQLENSNGFLHPLQKLSPNEDTRSVLRPYGVFAVISPFNFPLALSAGMSGAALLGGNSAVIKMPQVAGVAFTGSKEVGMHLMRTISTDYPKPALLEMGGKNAAIICEKADLEKAVEGCARSAFGLSGQKCSALSRVYVHKSLKDTFLKKLVEKAASFKIGDPALQDTYVGPVINEKAYKRHMLAVEAARKGGKILLGGEDIKKGELADGHYVAPVIADLPRGHHLFQDELFSPFLVVDTFETLEEAVREGGKSQYGLTAGIFSESKDDVEYFMNHMEAGILYANRKTGATTGAWPGVQSFCGWKGSGSTGKGGCGPYYVSQFMREQSQTRMG
jgi:1-pyrroline-5-carboxylate dehydrogenase